MRTGIGKRSMARSDAAPPSRALDGPTPRLNPVATASSSLREDAVDKHAPQSAESTFSVKRLAGDLNKGNVQGIVYVFLMKSPPRGRV